MSAVRIRSPTPIFMIIHENEPERQEELQGRAHLALQEIRKSKPPIIVVFSPPSGSGTDINEVREIRNLFEKKGTATTKD